MESVTQQGWTHQAVFFVSNEFPDEALYCALQYCQTVQQSPLTDFFDALLPAAVDAAAAEENADDQ